MEYLFSDPAEGILRVGTDCSGIEAPIQALKQLNIEFRHVFSSDIDGHCIKSIKANYHPEILFGDPSGPFPNGNILQRDNRCLPDIDLYVCGFPCQPFSAAGDRKGFEGTTNNPTAGIVFFACLDVIVQKQPRFFVLENVKGLLSHDRGKTFTTILRHLSDSLPNYTVEHRILDAKHFGIPQSRPRLFIVGSRDRVCVTSLQDPQVLSPPLTASFEITLKKTPPTWPLPVDLSTVGPRLADFVDHTDKTACPHTNTAVDRICSHCPEDAVFVDLKFRGRSFVNAARVCPCLNAQAGLWNVPLDRHANTVEYLRIQGFDDTFKQVVSNHQLKHQIGNSMCVNVLVALFRSLLGKGNKTITLYAGLW